MVGEFFDRTKRILKVLFVYFLTKIPHSDGGGTSNEITKGENKK